MFTQEDEKELREAKKKLEGVFAERMKGLSQSGTLEQEVGEYGWPSLCEWHKTVFRMVPKMLAELEFLRTVLAGAKDEWSALEVAERYRREKEEAYAELKRVTIGIREMADVYDKHGSLSVADKHGSLSVAFTTMRKMRHIVEELLKGIE